MLLSSCRIEVGLGPGIGAEVHLSGLVHTGAMAAGGFGNGTIYGREPGLFFGVVTVPGFHVQDSGFKRTYLHHTNLGLLPPLTAGVTGGREINAHPWAFEVGIALLFITIRLGVDPIGALIDELTRPEPPEPEFHTEATPELAAAARDYLSEAVAEYALGSDPEFQAERQGRQDRIRQAVRVCARAEEPVSIHELATWARSRLDGDDADTRAATVARELARYCGVALRTIRFEGPR